MKLFLSSLAHLFFLFICTSCASTSNLPQPTTSVYFETLGAGVSIKINKDNSDKNEAALYIVLKKLKSIPQGSLAIVKFQNPEVPGSPIVTQEKLDSTKDSYTFISPAVNGLKQGRSYSITMELYQDSSREKLLCEHSQSAYFP